MKAKELYEDIRSYWRAHVDEAARLIFQYATEKMTPEQRKRFKREKQQITR